MSNLSIIFSVMLLFVCKMLICILYCRYYRIAKRKDVLIKSLTMSLSCYSPGFNTAFFNNRNLSLVKYILISVFIYYITQH